MNIKLLTTVSGVLAILLIPIGMAKSATVSFDDVSVAPGKSVGVFGIIKTGLNEVFTLRGAIIVPRLQDGLFAEVAAGLPSQLPIQIGTPTSIFGTFGTTFFTITADDNVEPGTSFTFLGTALGSELTDTFTVTVVPEPFTLLGSGTALLFGTFFKRKSFKKR